jgi:hypothetical protein
MKRNSSKSKEKNSGATNLAQEKANHLMTLPQIKLLKIEWTIS